MYACLSVCMYVCDMYVSIYLFVNIYIYIKISWTIQFLGISWDSRKWPFFCTKRCQMDQHSLFDWISLKSIQNQWVVDVAGYKVSDKCKVTENFVETPEFLSFTRIESRTWHFSEKDAPGTPGFVLCFSLGTLRNPLLPLPAAWWLKCSTFPGEASNKLAKHVQTNENCRGCLAICLVNLDLNHSNISSANNRPLWVLSADVLISGAPTHQHGALYGIPSCKHL